MFFDDEDRRSYLRDLHRYATRHRLEILAYCLMDNHVHLVAVPATASALHRALKPVHMRHAQRINGAHDWCGHLWQERFFSTALDEAHLWAAIRYVELNPVRAALVARAQDYPWSSAPSHCGLRHDPVLTTDATWHRLLAGVRDWPRWLAEATDPECLRALRENTFRGLPTGSEQFVRAIELSTGRVLRRRRRGRPARVADPAQGRSARARALARRAAGYRPPAVDSSRSSARISSSNRPKRRPNGVR